MPNEAIILCGGAEAKPNSSNVDKTVRLKLFENVFLHSDDLARPVSSEVPSIFCDLIELATYVYVADQAVTRGGDGVDNAGANWRRRFLFTIPVVHLDFWRRAEVLTDLVETLSFLSEDEYNFDFIQKTDSPGVQGYLPFSEMGEPQSVDEVVLFSGGLDSVGGAIQEIQNKRSIALVNHRPTEKLSKQYRQLQSMLEKEANRIGVKPPIHIPVRINKSKKYGHEYTQRSRSFLYASIASAVATAYDLSKIRFYENGVIGLNLPLSPQVVGAKATRTTHPRVMRGFSKVLSHVAGKEFKVDNPFLWKTKSDVLKYIVDSGCGEIIQHSTSCTHTWEWSKTKTHCGTCSQCIDRRFAVLSAGADAFDPKEFYGADLIIDPRSDAEDRTMIASYVETASEVSKISASDFFFRYGEIGRIVNHIDGIPDAVALQVHDLYKRHGMQVSKVVDNAIARYATEIRNRELPESCLLRLVCDSGGVRPPALISAEEQKSALTEFVFRKNGQVWTVRFNSGTDFILLASKGAAYLHILMSMPQQRISAVTLAFRVAKSPKSYNLGGAIDKRPDDEAKSAYLAQYQELMQEKESAQKREDIDEVIRLEKDLVSLGNEIKQSGWHKRGRKQNDNRERVRKAVTIAIRRTILQIEKYDKKLAVHLKANVKCGNTPVYGLNESVDWEL